MKQDKQNINYNDLIAKYLSGNTSNRENQVLESYVLASSANKQSYLEMKKAWALANLAKTEESIDLNKEWKEVEGELFGGGKVVAMKPKRSTGFILQIAAAIALLVACSLWIFNLEGNNNELFVVTEGEVKEQQLMDGSEISLNKYSTAKYSFTEDGTRNVELKGDAFFDVAKDAEHPFVINTQEVDIIVLGTSFYVDSRDSQDNVQIIVTTGTVSVKANNQHVVLVKGEIGNYNKTSGQLTKRLNEDANFMSWKTNKLIYENERLEKVVFDLNRTFHSDIKLANVNLNDCKITAIYDQQTLDAILRILEKTLTLKATTNGEQIVISGSACN